MRGQCTHTGQTSPFKTACFHHSTGVRVTLSMKQDSCLCQEGELWLRTEDKPSQQPLAGLIVWPTGVPSERPQLTALSSQATRRASHCVQTASN